MKSQPVISHQFMTFLFFAMTFFMVSPCVRAEAYETADVYQKLRQHILTMDPKSIGALPEERDGVWGMVMEIGYPKSAITLSALANGAVSLYFTNGNGVTGAGGHEMPRATAHVWLEMAPEFLSHTEPATEFPLPAEGRVRFYFLTFDGVMTAEAAEKDLGSSLSPLSKLFLQGNYVITQIRLIDERKKAGAVPE